MSEAVLHPLNVDLAVARVLAYKRAHGLSNRRFAKLAGISASCFQGLGECGWTVRVGTLRKVEAFVAAAEAADTGGPRS